MDASYLTQSDQNLEALNPFLKIIVVPRQRNLKFVIVGGGAECPAPNYTTHLHRLKIPLQTIVRKNDKEAIQCIICHHFFLKNK